MNIHLIFPLFNGPYGGERHCLQLAQELAKKQHTVHIWTLKFDQSCEPLLQHTQGVELHIIKGAFLRYHTIAVLMSFMYMERIAQSIQIYCEQNPEGKNDMYVGMGWQSAMGLYHLRNSVEKRIYYCLEPPRFLYDLQSISTVMIRNFVIMFGYEIKKLDVRNVESVTRVITNSVSTSQEVKKIYKRNSNIVYPGLDIKKFTKITKQEAKEKLGTEKEQKIYLSVGKLHTRKKIPEAIDVFAEKYAHEPGIFYIIGTGPEKKNIESHIRTKNPEIQKNIHMLGQVSDDTVTTYMRAADYFIFTAYNEPFGMVITEAKAAGCTIIPKNVDLPVISWEESASSFLKAIYI